MLELYWKKQMGGSQLDAKMVVERLPYRLHDPEQLLWIVSH